MKTIFVILWIAAILDISLMVGTGLLTHTDVVAAVIVMVLVMLVATFFKPWRSIL